TSIFVTHDQEEAMMLSDYIAVMRDGEVIQYGPAAEIYRRPQHFYVATFIGKPRMGILEGHAQIVGDTLTFRAGDLRLQWPARAANGAPVTPIDTPVLLGIRAEDVRLTSIHAVATPDCMTGEIALIEPLGSDTFVEVNRQQLALTARVEPDRPLSVGDSVALHLPREKLHLFDATTQQRLPL
ncbi:MAG: ABC transporter ATP-binding protein, partial [Caldilineaceae bacterium]|nr:ABC transporter ATP-binding protein [Caldilineaceae bacterium]